MYHPPLLSRKLIARTQLPERVEATFNLLKAILYPAVDAAAYPILLGSNGTLSEALAKPFDIYVATSTDRNLRGAIGSAALSASSPCHLLPRSMDPAAQNIAIVSKTTPASELPRVAKLLARAKFCALGGQSLGALSFVAVHEEVHNELVRHLVAATASISTSAGDLCLRNDNSFSLPEKLDGRVVAGSATNSNASFASPIVIESVPSTSHLLSAAIRAPVLPVVPYGSTEDAIDLVLSR